MKNLLSVSLSMILMAAACFGQQKLFDGPLSSGSITLYLVVSAPPSFASVPVRPYILGLVRSNDPATTAYQISVNGMQPFIIQRNANLEYTSFALFITKEQLSSVAIQEVKPMAIFSN